MGGGFSGEEFLQAEGRSVEAPGLEKGRRGGAGGRLSLEVSGGRDGSTAWNGMARWGAQGDLVAIQDGGGGDLGEVVGAGGRLEGERQEWGRVVDSESWPDLGRKWGCMGSLGGV